MNSHIKELNPKEVLLENILAVTSTMSFGKNIAAKVVGGKGKLLKLIAEGKIETTKTSPTFNGKWFCNAAQVLQHCRNMR